MFVLKLNLQEFTHATIDSSVNYGINPLTNLMGYGDDYTRSNAS